MKRILLLFIIPIVLIGCGDSEAQTQEEVTGYIN